MDKLSEWAYEWGTDWGSKEWVNEGEMEGVNERGRNDGGSEWEQEGGSKGERVWVSKRMNEFLCLYMHVCLSAFVQFLLISVKSRYIQLPPFWLCKLCLHKQKYVYISKRKSKFFKPRKIFPSTPCECNMLPKLDKNDFLYNHVLSFQKLLSFTQII